MLISKVNNKRKLSELENNILEISNQQNTQYTCGSNIEIIDNHIYFYCDVNKKNILELNKSITILNKKLIDLKKSLSIEYDLNVDNLDDFVIYLHINSPGGYVTDAFSGVDAIINSRIPIYSIIEGYVASAATFLSIVCKKRYMTRHSSVLIHQLSGACWGTYQQMADGMKNNKYLHKKIKKLYKQYSKGNINSKLDQLLNSDLMLNLKKCKKMGIVDDVVK